MKNWIYGILIFIGIIAVGIGLSYAFGWIGVHQTSTIGAAKADAETEVFENTQAFVEGKKVDAMKYYREWKAAPEDERSAIEYYVRTTFMEFDEQKYLDEPLRTFVYDCKYN